LRAIEENFWMANITNIGGIILGFFGFLPPAMAGIMHVGHTLGIMFNSSRLLKWEAPGLKSRPDSKDPAAG
jgi:cation-transporting P-type ATPase C